MKNKRKTWLIITVAAVALASVPVILFAKRYYDFRYVLDEYYYTIVPGGYDITPYRDRGGRLTDYTLMCYNADGEARELSFSVLIDAHQSDLYPPGTFIRVSMSKQLVIGRRAVDKSDVPEAAMAGILADLAPSLASSASSLAEYAAARARVLAANNTAALSVSCSVDGSVLVYKYVYAPDSKESAEAAADLLDPVYYVQFRSDKDAFSELTAIVLEVALADGTVVFSQQYDKRVVFDYELADGY